MSEVTFFIFGTPSNKKGFEYVASRHEKLLGDPSVYLDKFSPSDMASKKTFITTPIKLGGKLFHVAAVYQAIVPNDSVTDRGAYIGVAALLSGSLELDQMIAYYFCIMQIHGYLSALRTNGAFAQDFDIKKINFEDIELNVNLPASRIVDILGRFTNGPFFQSRPLVFNESSEGLPDILKQKYFLSELGNASAMLADIKKTKEQYVQSIEYKDVEIERGASKIKELNAALLTAQSGVANHFNDNGHVRDNYRLQKDASRIKYFQKQYVIWRALTLALALTLVVILCIPFVIYVVIPILQDQLDIQPEIKNNTAYECARAKANNTAFKSKNDDGVKSNTESVLENCT